MTALSTHAEVKDLAGFTLVELVISLAVAALIAAIAIPIYQQQVERARSSRAISDIAEIRLELERWRSRRFSIPINLAQIGLGEKLDPWGNTYQYLNVAAGNPGMLRKDKNLVPINTQYDLYSRGPDGESRPPLTAPVSRDDIVLANDGGFIGIAEDY